MTGLLKIFRPPNVAFLGSLSSIYWTVMPPFFYLLVCDYEFNNLKIGWFTSPKFPNNYYENANCTYRIKTQRNNAIRISFTDFLLENKANGMLLDFQFCWHSFGNLCPVVLAYFQSFSRSSYRIILTALMHTKLTLLSDVLFF